MGKSVNKVILLGTVCREPEFKQVGKNNTEMVKFSVVTNERVKRGNEWEEESEFHNVVAWTGLAKVVRDYVHKGDKIYIEGRKKTEEWEKDGVKQRMVNIIVNDLTLLGQKRQQQQAPAQSQQGFSGGGFADNPADGADDLPF
jgi:single-strand DNA-binding protein